MQIAVIGTGYVGLDVGACLAETGNDVVCADVDTQKIGMLRENRIPIFEPGLQDLVERNQGQRRLRFTVDVGAAVAGAEVVFIAVGTPSDEDGSADLRRVLEAAETIGRHMRREMVVVTKSTVPVGTAVLAQAEVKALIRTATQYGETLGVLEAVEDANERQKRRLFEKLQSALGGNVRGAQIAVWGLAFKPNTDDIREAPALALIDALLRAGAMVIVHDPAAMTAARRTIGDAIRYADSSYDALEGADALMIVTDWNEYRHPDFHRMKAALKHRVVIDGRNLYRPNG